VTGAAARRRRGWGLATLRGRATVALAAVSVLLSTILVAAVWFAVTGYLMNSRERAAVGQAAANAAQVQRTEAATGLTPEQLLAQLPRETGSISLVALEGEWYTTSLRVGRNDLPPSLRRAVLRGTPSRQRIRAGGEPMLAVGIPLEGEHDLRHNRAYFEVFPLDDLDHTDRVLAVVLGGAAAAVVPLSAVVGWWVTRPTLRPLARVADAARAIAAGDLTARIDPRADPALVPIAESFNATAAALEERVRSDARFAADVSHELRSPLTTMAGAVSLVDGYADDLPEDGREGLALLHEELTRFERLVADLLEISRADAGTGDVTLEQVNLAALVGQALARRPAGSAPVPALTVADGADGLLVQADKLRLERVIGNLLDNADRHAGGATAVRVEATPTTARLLVDDAGPGVPAQERERIFERFARGSGTSRGSDQGAGLGLSLVARYARAMHGSVEVADSPDGGARFVVTLPREEASPCAG
jgi:two-component system, OmpR family, sensor histidine kinase MtrB